MNPALFKAILVISGLKLSKKKTKPLLLAGVLSERKALFSLTILVREAGLELWALVLYGVICYQLVVFCV